jgi:hypothetical protein
LTSTAVFAAGLCQSPATAETPKERVEAVASELAALGLRVDLSHLSVEVREPAACRDDIARSQDQLLPLSYFEGIRVWLASMGLDAGSSGESLREAAVDSLLFAYRAYYQADRNALVFLSDGSSGLRDTDDAIIAHELVHAWQDQTLDLFDTLASAGRSLEHARLLQCILEGHAEVVSLEAMLAREGKSLAEVDPGALESPLDTLVGGVLSLPYTEGRRFLARVYIEGGWPRVVGFLREPPSSTEQLMHPDKLGSDEPSSGLPLPDWPEDLGPAELRREDTIGELELQGFFLQIGSLQSKAVLAAAGWDGDRIRFWRYAAHGERPAGWAFLWRSAWDRELDAVQFLDIMTTTFEGASRRRGRVVECAYAEDWKVQSFLMAALDGSPCVLGPDLEDARTADSFEQSWLAAEERVGKDSWVLPRFGLSVAIPAGWAVEEVRGTPFLRRQEAPTLKPKPPAAFADNFNVIAVPRPQEEGLETLAAQMRLELGKALERIETVRVDGREALILHYSGQLESSQVELGFIALVYPRGGEYVVVTATLELERRAQWQEVIERTLRTASIQD